MVFYLSGLTYIIYCLIFLGLYVKASQNLMTFYHREILFAIIFFLSGFSVKLMGNKLYRSKYSDGTRVNWGEFVNKYSLKKISLIESLFCFLLLLFLSSLGAFLGGIVVMLVERIYSAFVAGR